jgi:flagellar biosynthesis protein FlhB
MAKDGRTEKATPRRKQKAREEGNVLKSKETGNFMSVASLAIIMIFFGEWLVMSMKNVLLQAFTMIKLEVHPYEYWMTLVGETVKVLLLVVVIVLIFQFLNYVVTVRYLFSWKAVKPDLKKINPKNYFQNVFSRRSLVEIVKSFVLFSILGYIVYYVFMQNVAEISGALLLQWDQSLLLLWDLFQNILIKVVIAMFLIAVLDYVYQKWEYEEKLKMKKHELRDEQKEQQGSPEVKAKQRQARMALLKNDIIEKTPEATFIAVNPTHYSVAVRYIKGVDPVPKVLVKGTDYLALFIRQVGKQQNIPIVENPPLARSLYAKVDEGEYIPEDLYLSVVSVLHHLIHTKKIKM